MLFVASGYAGVADDSSKLFRFQMLQSNCCYVSLEGGDLSRDEHSLEFPGVKQI